MLHWSWIVALAVAWLGSLIALAVFVVRRLRQSEEIIRVLHLVRNILKERSIPIDVEINQDIPVTLSGTYTLPTDFAMSVRLQDAIDIETMVPVRTVLPLDVVLESSVLKLGKVKVPIQGEIPISIDIPVKTKALIRSESVLVRLTEPLKLELPNLVVPLRARLRVNVPLRLPDPADGQAPVLPPTPTEPGPG